MSKKLKVAELLEYFNGVESVTSSQLSDYYKKMETNLSSTTIRGRIHRLKKNGVIYSLGGGLYSLTLKHYFEPKITSDLKSIYDRINKNFPHIRFCVWYTPWLNQFMHHQPFTNNVIIETERYAAKSVFQFVRAEITNTLFNPTHDDLEDYGDPNSILVSLLLFEAPVKEYDGVMIPTLEKLLVDIYSGGPLYIAYQGREMDRFFKNAVENYTINFKKLFRYAKRRGLYLDLHRYFKEYLGINMNYDKDIAH